MNAEELARLVPTMSEEKIAYYMTPSPAPIANGTRVEVLATSMLPSPGLGTVIKGEYYWGLGRYTVALDSGDRTYPGGQILRVL